MDRVLQGLLLLVPSGAPSGPFLCKSAFRVSVPERGVRGLALSRHGSWVKRSVKIAWEALSKGLACSKHCESGSYYNIRPHNPPLALPAGGGASFCVRHAGPTEPTGTAPLLDPAVRSGSVRSVHLLLKPQVGLGDGVVRELGGGPSGAWERRRACHWMGTWSWRL